MQAERDDAGSGPVAGLRRAFASIASRKLPPSEEAPATGGSSTSHALLIGGILLAALVVRLIAYFQLSQTPFGQHAFLDSSTYDVWAERIASGDWLGGDKPFFVEPGYLYFLALSKRLGADIFDIRLLQALVGTGTVGLTMILAGRLGGRAAAELAGGVVALYPPLIHFEGLLLKTTFGIFFATLVIVLATSSRLRPFTIGFVSSVTLCLKANFALFVPFLLATCAWREREDRRRLARLVALFALGLGPLLLLVAARNYAVSGEALVLPWNSGINFYIGNGPEADGLDPTVPFMAVAPRDEVPASKREAERRTGRALGYAESSQYWWDLTREHILRDPVAWLGLMVQKTRYFLHEYEFTDNISLYFVRERVPILRWLPFGFAIVVAFSFAGLATLLFERSATSMLLSLYLVLQAASVIGFHVIERYRLAVVPCAAALGAAALFAAARSRGGRRWVPLAAFVLGWFVSAAVPPPSGALVQNMAGHHRLLGLAAMEEGDFQLAASEFERACALNPGIPQFHFRLSIARRLLGDDAGAKRAAEAGLRLDPERGALQLAALLMPSNPAEAASTCLAVAEPLGQERPTQVQVDALHCAGTALTQAGDAARAEALLLRGVARAPGAVDLWRALSEARLALGDGAGAERAQREADRLMSKGPTPTD